MSSAFTATSGCLVLLSLAGPAGAQAADAVRTGAAPYGDWQSDAPGVWRKITANDLPAPSKESPRNAVQVAPAPQGAAPKTLPGFAATPFATLDGPRQIKMAPNGDLFVAESLKGQIRVLRAKPGAAKAETTEIYASGLDRPFGMAFYPAKNPRWLYVSTINTVVRFPYARGDLKAGAAPEMLIPKIATTTGGHWTRDIAFTADGKRLLLAVGSASNYGQAMPTKTAEEIAAWEKDHGVGSSWGPEEGRAEVRSYTPEGKDMKVFATGIRNCVGLTVQPANGAVWCTTNERDVLGDDLVPDYASPIKQGGFYGWPWFYIGANREQRKEARPDLAAAVSVPQVLIQPHSAALQTTFYPATPRGAAAFAPEWRGQAFTALHGSWNRSKRTGYKVVRLKIVNGAPTGEYEDFLTGFVIDDQKVWGRPVGLAVAQDGALMVTEDANGVVWRVAPTGR